MLGGTEQTASKGSEAVTVKGRRMESSNHPACRRRETLVGQRGELRSSYLSGELAGNHG